MALNGPEQPYRQTARRDFGLLNRAYRRAKMKGDFGKALEYSAMGDTMGIPVGRPAASEELEGVGDYRYGRDMAISGAQGPLPTIGGYDNRHSSQSGIGVGGYNFNQSRNQGLNLGGDAVPNTGMLQGGDTQGPP